MATQRPRTLIKRRALTDAIKKLVGACERTLEDIENHGAPDIARITTAVALVTNAAIAYAINAGQDIGQ